MQDQGSNQEGTLSQTPEIVETVSTPGLSRRALLTQAGISSLALTLLATTHQKAAVAAPHASKNALMSLPDAPELPLAKATTDGAKQQFPYFTDAPWDKPQYYDTIYAGRKIFPKTHQMADVDGDGRDELIARGPGGIHINRYDPESGQWVPMNNGPRCPDADNWDQRQYYETFQCADIDGDGRAEILARGSVGITAWKYAPSSTGDWKTLNPGPALTDASAWDQPQYYQTIQFADIDNDNRAELVARGTDGIFAWKYNPGDDSWTRLPDGPKWSDAVAWNRPQYYSTIQLADIDADGRAELIGRGEAGLLVYKFTGQAWEQLPTNIYVNDVAGWHQPAYYETLQAADVLGTGTVQMIGNGPLGAEIYVYGVPFNKQNKEWYYYNLNQSIGNLNKAEYFQTLQCADIDGDGKAELLVRDANGLQAWKYTNEFRALPSMSAWSDANNWNQVQYYATIQTARVLKPGDTGYTGDGVHTQAVLLGRGSLGMQTYRFVSEQVGWVQTSAELPLFTPAQREAYAAIPRALNISGFISDIRSTYNDRLYAAGYFAMWQGILYNGNLPIGSYEQMNRPDCSLPPPAGIDKTAWNEVTWQIYWEIQWVRNVYAWYGDDAAGGLINKDFISRQITLQQVGNYLHYDNDSSATIGFALLSLIASAAAAILTAGASLGVEAAALGVASAIAGGMSAAFGTLPPLSSGETIYRNLQDAINDRYGQAVAAQEKLLFAITGGAAGGQVIPPDYGRLKLIGEWIEKRVWTWDTSPIGGATNDYLVQAGRGYAIYVWQSLITSNQVNWFINTNPLIPSSFPVEYRFPNSPNDYVHLMSNWGEIPNETLDTLFKPATDTTTFPLGVPVRDVYLGWGGWPQLARIWVSDDNTPINYGAVPPQNAHIVASPTLSRDPVTREIVANVRLRNLGMTSATNVEVTEARLGANPMVARHGSKALHLFYGHPQTVQLRFPPAAGSTFILRLSGRYEGSTFGGSYRLTVS